MGEDKSVLRWGGIAGILAGVLFILAIITFFALLPLVRDAAEDVMRFPELRAAWTAFGIFSLVGAILTIPLFLALYRALRGTSLAAALFATVLGVLGAFGLAFNFASGFGVFPALSDLFVNAASPEERTTVVLLWEATRGIIDQAGFAGAAFLAVGAVSFGVAMLGSPDFGKGFGGVGVVLGLAAVVDLSIVVVMGLTAGGFVAFFAFIIFLFLFGWKVYSLSRAA